MEQTGDTDLMDLCLGKSLLLGNDHSDGCNIDTVLEGVFITCLECGDIDRDRVVLVDGREQIGSDRVGCLYHFRRTGIAVYILDSLRDTFTDARGQCDLGTVIGTKLFNILFCSGARRGSLHFLIFLAVLNINTHNPHLNHRVNHVFVKFCAAGNQIAAETVYDRMIQFHTRFQLSCAHIFPLYQFVPPYDCKIVFTIHCIQYILPSTRQLSNIICAFLINLCKITKSNFALTSCRRKVHLL